MNGKRNFFINRGHRNKVKEGIWPQMSPIGYVNEKGKGIVPHPELSILVKKTFEAYATGNFTLREVRDKFNALGLKRKGGRELAVSNYQKLLKNPIYTGLMRYNGEIFEKFLKYNMELANDRTNEENTHLFKKVGSNFLIKDRTLLFEPRGAWKTLLDSGFGGGDALGCRHRRDPVSASKCDFDFWRKR